MNISKHQWTLTIIAIYLLAVVVSIFRAFDFKGAINLDWTLVLVGLTLPWSLVSILFVWGLIHGAGLEFFTGMYLVFALLNSRIFYWLRTRRRKSEIA
jgi:hypothetical protein